MSRITNLKAEKRTGRGSINNRRLRNNGLVPGNIYGHKQNPEAIQATADDVHAAVMSGHRVVDVTVDGHTEKTLLREVQWDTFGISIQHFDLMRIDPDERVTVEVPLELKGIAPGILAGGVLDQHLRSLTLECLAIDIPDSIPVRISELEIGQAIHVSEVQIPPNSTVDNAPDTVVVQVVLPRIEEPVAAAEVPGPAEPELIGKKEPKEGEEEEPAAKKG